MNLLKKLKNIREELIEALNNKDIIYAKMQVNKLDTIIHNLNIKENE